MSSWLQTRIKVFSEQICSILFTGLSRKKKGTREFSLYSVLVRWLIIDSLQPWWSLIWKNTCQTDFSQFFQRPIFKTSFLIKRFFLASVIIFLGTLSHVIIASFVISCSHGFSARPLFFKRPYWFFVLFLFA